MSRDLFAHQWEKDMDIEGDSAFKMCPIQTSLFRNHVIWNTRLRTPYLSCEEKHRETTWYQE